MKITEDLSRLGEGYSQAGLLSKGKTIHMKVAEGEQMKRELLIGFKEELARMGRLSEEAFSQELSRLAATNLRLD